MFYQASQWACFKMQPSFHFLLHSDSQGSWKLFKIKQGNNKTFSHVDSLGCHRALSVFIWDVGGSLKNLQRTWNDVEESFNLPSSPSAAARCFKVVNSGSNPELSYINISLGHYKLENLTDILIRYLVHHTWICFTTRARGSNLAQILSLATRLRAAAHQRHFNSSISNCSLADAYFEWRTTVWKNVMQMVNKNAWARTLRPKNVDRLI